MFYPSFFKPGIGFASKLRSLGTMEEYFWALQQRSSRTIVITTEIDTIFTIEIWRAAFRALQSMHMLLSVKIHKSSGVRPFFEIAPKKAIPLTVFSASEEVQIFDYCKREVDIPFAPKGLLVRAAIFQGNGKSSLVISADHAAFDGRSVIRLINDLLSAIAGERDIKLNPLIPSHDQLLGLKTSENYLNLCNNTEFNAAKPNAPRPVVYQLEQIKLDPSTVTAITQRARHEKTTVHGALAAALLLAGRKKSPNWKNNSIRCATPIDNRNLLGMADQIGLLLTVAFTEMQPSIDYEFWLLARKITDDIRALNNVPASANSLAPLRNIIKSEYDIDVFSETIRQRAHDMMVTNYGQLSIRSSFGRFRVLAITPMVATGDRHTQTISVSTFDGILSMTNISAQPFMHLLEHAKKLIISQLGK